MTLSVGSVIRSVTFAAILLAATPVQAEYLRIQIRVLGLDCDLCARGVSASVQRMAGVKSVEISLKNGTVDIVLFPGNSLKMTELRKRIRDNGFRATDATVTAVGRFNGQKFEVAGSNEYYEVRSDSQSTGDVEITFNITK